jgi:dihydrofolate synthase/folylpolyglutamate synthase
MANASRSDDYAESIAYLYGRINYEYAPAAQPRKLNLENMRRLLERLGNPQLKIPVVHIAGTKGKGSTSTMVASILGEAGYRTGLYISPHLTCLEERYSVNRVQCGRDELVQLVQQIRPIVELIDQETQSTTSDNALTFFEITTAIAWLYFIRQQAEIVVLEVGMGGRLDSTNLCQPLVTVITSISFDHTKQLGNTLVAIAREKAGIIKPGIPVISGIQQPDVQDVIQQVADAAHAPLFSIGKDFQISAATQSIDTGNPSIENRLNFEACGRFERGILRDVQVGLLGEHQLRNAGVALSAIRCLQELGWKIDERAIRRGLTNVPSQARIEVIRREPTIIIDTAHNVASIAALVETLNQHFPVTQRVLILAASRDKDIRGMLAMLVLNFDEIICTQFETNPRAVDAQTLAKLAGEIAEKEEANGNCKITVRQSPSEAWSYCREHLRRDSLVCVTGSFFLAAELRPIIQGKQTADWHE